MKQPTPITKTLLIGAYLALEGYFLSLVAQAFFGHSWFASFLSFLLGVVGAYLMFSLVMARQSTRKKRAILASIILALTILIGLMITAAKIYMDKLSLHSSL